MTLSKKYYKSLGYIIRQSFKNKQNESSEISELHSILIHNLCDYFQEDNPNFSRQRFIEFMNRRGD